jgi:cytochrome b6-f complex iron-sulfur subunit
MTDNIEQQEEEKTVSRRGFMLGAWGLSFLVMMGESTLALLKLARPLPNKGGFGGVISAGFADDFEVGSVTENTLGRFFLVRLEDGFIAMSKKCTHLGCAVPWVEEEHQFHCPCHGSIYNLEGEVQDGPAPRPLDLFPIEIVEGEIMVDTGSATKRDEFDMSQLAQLYREAINAKL